ncbi:MAG TPA: hypothetical protein ENI97_02340 [Gammaproteobacteria bacterium]|nr:hypothetical protein [Gammaproteobacteria bacterium]
MRHVIVFLLLGLSPLGVFADDHEQARQLKEAGEILPLTVIIKKAQARHPGRVIAVEFENEDGRHLYEVEILDKRGVVWELYFDAATGDFVKREREDY